MAQVWIEHLVKYRTKYKQFMRGRYARFDMLNRTLLIFALFFSLFRYWLPFSAGYILFASLMSILVYRLLSKKIYPRLNENQKF